MARVLSHPLRLGTDGGFVTVEQDTDPSLAEQLAVLLQTRLGERELVPLFGIPDPVFHQVTVEDINVALDTFGPPLQVEDVSTTIRADGYAEVTVTYDES